MCPGADDETLSLVLPTLRKVAAKSPEGKPCVGRGGTGGAGHYCKMIHNGIEHGMMSTIAEAYGIMRTGLGMSLEDISNVFDAWNSSGELKGTFLIWISRDICRTKDKSGQYVLDTVEDKVVQDYTGEEGTGIWSNIEAVDKHVPAPTLTVAHYLRIASGDRHQRARIQKTFGVGSGDPNKDHVSLYPAQKLEGVRDQKAFLEDLRMAVYTGCLSAYCQGMIIIDKADKQFHFNVNYTELLQVWRAGCIIQADYISNSLLQPIYESLQPGAAPNPLFEADVARDLKKGFSHLKKVVVEAVSGDHVVPALSATLEWLQYQTSTELPTSFYEAQLDYYGKHMFDRRGGDANKGLPETGAEHFEWKPA